MICHNNSYLLRLHLLLLLILIFLLDAFNQQQLVFVFFSKYPIVFCHCLCRRACLSVATPAFVATPTSVANCRCLSVLLFCLASFCYAGLSILLAAGTPYVLVFKTSFFLCAVWLHLRSYSLSFFMVLEIPIFQLFLKNDQFLGLLLSLALNPLRCNLFVWSTGGSLVSSSEVKASFPSNIYWHFHVFSCPALSFIDYLPFL